MCFRPIWTSLTSIIEEFIVVFLPQVWLLYSMTMENTPHLLLVDDDAATRLLLERFCKDQPFTVALASSGEQALQRYQEKRANLVITDLQMPDMSGEKVLQNIKKLNPDTGVLIMTQYASIEDAVRILQLGADDYITKPINKDTFLHRLGLALDRVSLNQELAALKKAVARSSRTTIIGQSPAIFNLHQKISVAADSNAAVVVYGESGTGKELVASNIHSQSKRSGKAFVTVNCGSIPDTLIESELFGYKRGAFTDAHQDTPGLVEEAEGGTLFLDEIGDISAPVQVKLLRFLQSKEYKPLGVAKARTADVRIVAATNRNLEKLVQEGTFREDLFFRLNVIPLNVPPLRHRKEDITLLTAFFLERYQQIHGREDVQLPRSILNELTCYDWPGNVRELENKIQQWVVLSRDGLLDGFDLLQTKQQSGEHVFQGTYKEEKQQLIKHFEQRYVAHLLNRAKGNLSQAAKLAGLDRKNFWVMAKKHALWPQNTEQGHG